MKDEPSDRIKFGGSVLAAIIFGLTVSSLGAPVWASFGFAYIAYGQFRARDRERWGKSAGE